MVYMNRRREEILPIELLKELNDPLIFVSSIKDAKKTEQV